jgi:pyruvate kinase
MVARGDLGVEVSFDRVPMIQKLIVAKCVTQAKPVIIATQMMESMISSFTPTRAEANDVANAVLDGADALMLSGETSVGKYPVQTIQSMQKIINFTELHGNIFNRKYVPVPDSPTFLEDSICYNAVVLAKQIRAKAIIAVTNSGYTAYRLASYRPEAKIFAVTNNEKLLQKLSMVWGVRAYYVPLCETINEVYFESIKILKLNELIEDGEIVVHVASIPVNLQGRANMIKLTQV